LVSAFWLQAASATIAATGSTKNIFLIGYGLSSKANVNGKGEIGNQLLKGRNCNSHGMTSAQARGFA
jgi:hypothetical protein